MKEPTFEEIMNYERAKWHNASKPELVVEVKEEKKPRGRKPKKVIDNG